MSALVWWEQQYWTHLWKLWAMVNFDLYTRREVRTHFSNKHTLIRTFMYITWNDLTVKLSKHFKSLKSWTIIQKQNVIRYFKRIEIHYSVLIMTSDYWDTFVKCFTIDARFILRIFHRVDWINSSWYFHNNSHSHNTKSRTVVMVKA